MGMFVQGIGVIALICWVLGLQQKDKNKILKLQVIANLIYGVEYFLLNAFSAACMNIVSTIRSIIFAHNEKKEKEISAIYLILFIIVILVIAIFTCNSYFSLIPIIITIMYTYATWQKNTRVIRIVFFSAAVIWIIYNYTVGAYAPLIGNVIEVICDGIAIIRLDILKKKNTIEEEKKKFRLNR